MEISSAICTGWGQKKLYLCWKIGCRPSTICSVKGGASVADEIIKLLEYIINNPAVKGIAVVYAIIFIGVFIGVIAVFVFVFRQMKKMDDDFNDFRGRRRR